MLTPLLYFRLFSNREGKFHPGENAVYADILLFLVKDTSRTIAYEYGLELYGRTGSSSNLWVHQAYGGLVFYDLFRIRSGMWHETVGSILPEISSGSIIWSGNARPMPKAEIGIPEYATLPFANHASKWSRIHGKRRSDWWPGQLLQPWCLSVGLVILQVHHWNTADKFANS